MGHEGIIRAPLLLRWSQQEANTKNKYKLFCLDNKYTTVIKSLSLFYRLSVSGDLADVHEEHKHLHVGKPMTQARMKRADGLILYGRRLGQNSFGHKQSFVVSSIS